MPFGLRYVIGYGACTAPPENASQFRRIREAKVPKAVAPMLRPWYWPMKLRMRGRPLASIACFTAPSAAPVPESSKNTRVRFSDDRPRGEAPRDSAEELLREVDHRKVRIHEEDQEAVPLERVDGRLQDLRVDVPEVVRRPLARE